MNMQFLLPFAVSGLHTILSNHLSKHPTNKNPHECGLSMAILNGNLKCLKIVRRYVYLSRSSSKNITKCGSKPVLNISQESLEKAFL